ncbi:PEP-utilizing enzyme [Kaistia dalseonensis]|uniref:Pyruvate,water dikinase n=1 Tax=Kaistia dalseonensis TaxID=410840 RepID=A0ABU0H8R0_9HYPH|nr:PEP-utilizing enzyme [Kaistia dalseonensis]MCX5496071.1 PEP-utilizing enzyme [Kaistia dalseonensis]MDQ0438675.1 pyruvate,water dikinase [Kaistia dalseonensis]
MTKHARFPSPYDLPPPKGAEDWKGLYPYYLTFKDKLRSEEDAKFWFCDAQHWPSPFKPFDAITVEFAVKCLGQYNTRHYMVPPANGVEYRIHNGYCYMSPVAVAPELIAARVPQFIERAGHYFNNWDALLQNWDKKVRANIADMEAIHFEALPEAVPLEWIKDGIGLDNTYALNESYDRLIQLLYKTWQYHFEFLNLGYAAYLDFFGFLKGQFPSIPDQAIAKMVQGVEVDLFRPDDELKKLARLAVELGVDTALASGTVEEALAAVGQTPKGDVWLKAWKDAQDPWFNFTSGNGFYSDDKYWIDHLDLPLGYIRDYIVRVKRGETIERPIAAIAAERERITAEYAELLDDEARAAFEGKLGLARTVFPYVENHNFYIEHWSMSVFWRKMRELGQILHEAGFWKNPNDIFYLTRQEIRDVLFDYGNGWAVGAKAAGPDYWPEEIERRAAIMAALATQPPEPALNEPPAVITEPFTIMLWGITTDRINAWLGDDDTTGRFTGMAASPGRVEGKARVIRSASQLDEIEDGEILVAPVTAPSWAPVFGRIRAIVTDVGGMMSHAAIVCREYGLPAVTGTGNASSRIQNGQMLRVDGTTGEVTLLL